MQEEHDYTIYQEDFGISTPDFTAKYMDINDPEALPYLQDDPYTRQYIPYLQENTGEIVVDLDSNRLVGYIFVGEKTDPGFISTLVVNPEYRGYGFGRDLLEDAIQNYRAFDLVVDRANKTALQMYRDHGFVVVGYGKDKSQLYMKLRSELTPSDTIIVCH